MCFLPSYISAIFFQRLEIFLKNLSTCFFFKIKIENIKNFYFLRTVSNIARTNKNVSNNDVEAPELNNNKRFNNRSKLKLMDKLTEAFSKPVEIPAIHIPPLQFPEPSKRASRDPDFFEGFLQMAGYQLRTFPRDVAEDLIDDFYDQIRIKRRELRRNEPQAG